VQRSRFFRHVFRSSRIRSWLASHAVVEASRSIRFANPKYHGPLHGKCSGKKIFDPAGDSRGGEADAILPQSESVLIQKLYTHFKKAPGTHKLGVLYVVDSVTRKWTEQAKSAGQPINSSAQDGTFAAGVHRVKELLPVLMNDIILSAPDDQKVRPNIRAL
jgi:hypothetical protein